MKLPQLRVRFAAAIAVVVLVAGCTTGSVAARTTPSQDLSIGAGAHQARPVTVAPSATAGAVKPGPGRLSKGPRGFVVMAVSFVGRRGWALGSVRCGAGRCAAIAHSTDHGLTWRRLATPPVHAFTFGEGLGQCAYPCVSQIRFVTDRVGYLFDGVGLTFRGRAFFMSTDGGHTWHQQPGGADAVTAAGGTVIRVYDINNCPPACVYRGETGAAGAHTWIPLALPQKRVDAADLSLASNGDSVDLEEFGFPEGGGESAPSGLWTSSNAGATWTSRGEPCQGASSREVGAGREIDTTQFTRAPDSSLTLVCARRFDPSRQFLETSIDGGESFAKVSHLPRGGITDVAAATAETIVISSDTATYRSTDGGRHFARVTGPTGELEFTTPLDGYGISANRRTVRITTNAGRTWHGEQLP